MIQFITVVLDFLSTIFDSSAALLAFLPVALSYINYFINQLPAFLIPSFAITISILVFNRISSH